VPDSVLSSDFWQAEALLLSDALSELVMMSLLAGVDGGAALLPAGAVPLVDFDFVNRAAIQFLRDFRLETVMGITETTRRASIEAIADWMQSGEHLDVLKAKLRPLFGKTRADMIAITEVTRIVAAGNEMLWNSTGIIGGKQWRTARDERVCPICRPLDGQITELNGNFNLTVAMIATSPAMQALVGNDIERAQRRAASLLNSVGTIKRPPAHVRCRCWESPIVSVDLVGQEIDRILAGG
jgi:SPP1 gp7 family putative phage head morphogenesis protein